MLGKTIMGTTGRIYCNTEIITIWHGSIGMEWWHIQFSSEDNFARSGLGEKPEEIRWLKGIITLCHGTVLMLWNDRGVLAQV